MNDLLAGLGIALVLEGLLWAVAPDFGRRMLGELASLPERQLAIFAWVMVISGLLLAAMARG